MENVFNSFILVKNEWKFLVPPPSKWNELDEICVGLADYGNGYFLIQDFRLGWEEEIQVVWISF